MILLVSDDSNFVEKAKEEFMKKRFVNISILKGIRNPLKLAKIALDKIKELSPSIFIIDGYAGCANAIARRIISDPSYGIRLDWFEEESMVNFPIPTILLVAAVEEKRRIIKSPVPIIIYCVSRPSGYFTQEILSAGADWVWESRTDFKLLNETAKRLINLRSTKIATFRKRGNESSGKYGRKAKHTVKPSIFVVENSYAELKILREELEADYKIHAALENVRSGGEWKDLRAEEAISWYKKYMQKYSFKAAIIDLALSSRGESQATREFKTEESARTKFLSNDKQIKHFINFVLPGLKVIKALKRISLNMPVIIYSNYAVSATQKSAIYTWLDMKPDKSIKIVEKSQREKLPLTIEAMLNDI